MEIDEKGLRYLLKLVELGVKVHSIPIIYTEFDISRPLSNGHESLSFVEGLRGLVAGIGCQAARQDFEGVRKLAISDTTHSQYLLPILSAAQVSTSLRTVYLHILQEEPAVRGQIDSHLVDLWRCVAYTLFSPDAEHKITRLELTLNHFRAEYVDAIRAVLWAWRPVSPRTLGAGVFDALLGHRSQRLRCSKVYLFDPRGDTEAEACFIEMAPTDLRVIDPGNADDDIRTVLLPGWGKGWARDTANLLNAAQKPLPTLPRVDEIRSFKEVSIVALNEASMPAATTLMNLIGRRVEQLEVAAVDNNIVLDTWIANVFPLLPSLCKLVLVRGRIDNLDSLTNAINSAEREIRCLALRCRIRNAEQLQRFFDAIGDPLHRLGTHLGELQLKISARVLPVLHALCDALRHNRRLSTIRLKVFPSPSQVQQDAIMQLLSPTVEAAPTCRVAPLGLGQKMAFLSVVEHYGEATFRSSSVRHLDNTMLSTIFQFAAHGKKLHFQVSFVD